MTNTPALHTYLDIDLISVQSDVSSKKKLLQNMARMLSVPLPQKNKEKDVYHLLLEREKLGNTGVGNGVALPHSRCGQAHKAIIAIITLSEAIDYESLDRQPVDVAFGLLVPKEATQEHLNLLADIARMMSNDERKAQLVAAKTSTQVIELVASWANE
jgi:PTS system nitrogen regulatory IIA component